MPSIQAEIDFLTLQINGNPRNDDLYFRRGKLYWRLDNRGAAITDFNTAISLNPNSSAKAYLKMANDILDFYNTDLYNP